MVAYDPNVIHQHAQRLYDRALGIIIIYGVGFGLLGLFGGAVLGRGADFTPGLAIFAGPLLGVLGVQAGRARGFELRLQAQMALCQVQIEFNGRSRVQPGYAAPPLGYPSA
jgi:hypothetical protein